MCLNLFIIIMFQQMQICSELGDSVFIDSFEIMMLNLYKRDVLHRS